MSAEIADGNPKIIPKKNCQKHHDGISGENPWKVAEEYQMELLEKSLRNWRNNY